MLKANVSVVLLFFRPIIFFVLLCHLLTQILSFIEKELNIVIKLLRLKKNSCSHTLLSFQIKICCSACSLEFLVVVDGKGFHQAAPFL